MGKNLISRICERIKKPVLTGATGLTLAVMPYVGGCEKKQVQQKFDPNKEYYFIMPTEYHDAGLRANPKASYYLEKEASVPSGYSIEESFGVKGAMSGEWLNKNSSTDLAVDPADYNIYIKTK